MTVPALAAGAIIAAAAFIAVTWFIWRWRYPEKQRADEAVSITTDDGWRICAHRYRPRNVDGPGEPVLLCHGAFSNHWNFEEPRGESFADSLAGAGYDCWVLDYRSCRSAVPPEGVRRTAATMDDILMRDLPAAIERIRAETGFSQVHWVGHSLGGMLLYMAECAWDDWPVASAATLGSPPGFDGLRIRRRRFLRLVIEHAFTVTAFFARWSAALAALIRINHPMFPINWRNLHPDVTPGTFFNLVDLMPHGAAGPLEHWAATNTWIIRDGVDVREGLKHLRTPLLAIFGAGDPLVPLANARRFFDAIALDDKRMLMLSRENGSHADYSHVDLAFARHGETEIHAPIIHWFRQHPIPQPERPSSPIQSSIEDSLQ